MKKITLLLMVALAAINISAATIVIPEEAKAWNIPAEAIDVLQAREICAGLEADVPTTENYYVMGYVKRVSSKNAETVSQYGQARFYLENVKEANSEEEFDAYQVHGLNGVKINNPDVVAAGDFVVIYGPLTKHQYEGGDVAYQTPGKGAAYIWNSTNPKLHNDTATTPETPTDETLVIPDEAKDWNIPAEAIDVVKAREICAGLASGATSGTKYYVMGYVKKIHSKHADGVANFGNAQFYMENVQGANSSNDFMAYQVYGPNGQKITDVNSVAVGDFVVVYGELTNYNGTYETVGKGAAYIWNSTNPLLGSTTPSTPPTGGAIVFDASVDQGDAPIYADGVSGAQYTVTKNNVTLTVSSGVIGTANSLTAYRIYKGSTLTVSSSAGNIKSIVFTCTAENDAKQGPGCFTVDGGDYTYAGTVGTWTGDAATITFTASTNQVRATQIVVTLANATAVEDVTVGATPVKVIENGQVLIIRGEHIYNVLGAQVK